MKIKSLIIALVAVIMLVACGGGTTESASNGENESAAQTVVEAAEMNYALDTEDTKVMWRGEVAGVYGHEGLINVSEGTVAVKGETITGGSIVIDMTSIMPTDSASYKDEDGSRATDLVGHLSTGDFFLVEEFPTASFVIKSHSGNQLVGDLTVRGTTKEVSATISSMEVSNEGLTATADLVFNRQDFGVSWVHYMKDMVLSDDITLKIEVVGKS